MKTTPTTEAPEPKTVEPISEGRTTATGTIKPGMDWNKLTTTAAPVTVFGSPPWMPPDVWSRWRGLSALTLEELASLVGGLAPDNEDVKRIVIRDIPKRDEEAHRRIVEALPERDRARFCEAERLAFEALARLVRFAEGEHLPAGGPLKRELIQHALIELGRSADETKYAALAASADRVYKELSPSFAPPTDPVPADLKRLKPMKRYLVEWLNQGEFGSIKEGCKAATITAASRLVGYSEEYLCNVATNLRKRGLLVGFQIKKKHK
ncbi:MAG: hypothetical protein A2284_13430 [Deltaproteobacteria bacterium RIFOXYA12_FULL_61_11]|nr:MAG: hypothetical protein A2284_13430 [Deltaproteobacteria bacterium RIFOXYA12_FULL_61_11]